MNVKKSIAERKLLYSIRDMPERKKLIVRITAPYLVDKDMANFKFDHGTAGCTIEFDGLPESSIDVHGIDLLHALALAVDIDPYLEGMKKKYDFYWITGEPYFEER